MFRSENHLVLSRPKVCQIIFKRSLGRSDQWDKMPANELLPCAFIFRLALKSWHVLKDSGTETTSQFCHCHWRRKSTSEHAPPATTGTWFLAKVTHHATECGTARGRKIEFIILAQNTGTPMGGTTDGARYRGASLVPIVGLWAKASFWSDTLL